MIPKFPSFKKLKLSDREEIEIYIKRFPPYSDYNFVSLYSYNTQDKIELSYLNNNLVVLFEDYITGELIYSFLGTNKLQNTTQQLLRMAEKKKITKYLKFFPEVNFAKGPKEIPGFHVTENPDNFDYILSLEALSLLDGQKYHDKRNLYNRFRIENPDAIIKLLNLSDEHVQREIIQLFSVWVKRKQKSKKDTEHEKIAITRLLKVSPFLNLIAIGIYKQDRLISFAISEVLNDKFSIFHFVKADINYKGIFETTYNALGKELMKVSCIYINYEQDLGIENLRKSKQLWRPVKFLKKYIITPKK